MAVTVLTLIAILAIVLFGSRLFPNLFGGRGIRCTRCDGTGQVSERWPDPSEPGGWHHVEGMCPKCKGKGTVRLS